MDAETRRQLARQLGERWRRDLNEFLSKCRPVSGPAEWTDLADIFGHFLPGVELETIQRFIQERQAPGTGERVTIAGSCITAATLEEIIRYAMDLDIFVQTTTEKQEEAVSAWIALFERAGYTPTPPAAVIGQDKYDFGIGIEQVVTMECEGRTVDLVFFSKVIFESIIQLTDFAHCISYVAFLPSEEEEGVTQPLCVVADPCAVRDRLLIQNGTILPLGRSTEIRAMAEKRRARFDKYVARGWSAEHIPGYRGFLTTRLDALRDAY
jgi:hypothetical protein